MLVSLFYTLPKEVRPDICFAPPVSGHISNYRLTIKMIKVKFPGLSPEFLEAFQKER